MKISRHELWQSAKVLALALILSVSVPYALAWTGPTASPPGNNTPTPINVGATSQTKSGGFWAGSLGSGTICIGSDCRTAWPTDTDTNSGGDITGVTAGTGLSGGGTTGTVTLNNAGVTSISGGTGVSVSGSTGAVTISASGVPSGSLVGACNYLCESEASCYWQHWGVPGGVTNTNCFNFNNASACPAGSTQIHFGSVGPTGISYVCQKN